MIKNNDLFLFAILGLVFIFGLYCLSNKRTDVQEKFSEVKKKPKKRGVPDVEFIETHRVEDAFELLESHPGDQPDIILY